jgi:hypothetical protein
MPKVPLSLTITIIWLGFYVSLLADSDNRPEPSFIKVKTDSQFSQACAPDALAYACFKTEEEAEAFFAAMDLPFDKRMLSEIEGRTCHLFYVPSIKGFRADPDNKPVTELFFDVQSLRFATRAERRIGDPLDMMRSLLYEIERPLEIHIGINKLLDDEVYQQAKDFYFKHSPHRIVMRNSHTDADHWPQDYLKSGSSHAGKKILVPYRLYEGIPEYGEFYKSLLDGFSEQRFVRSKLSWEGGDLQLVLHPKDRQKTVLFYGYSAKAYWGTALSKDEYAYVLKVEFGAEQVVDLSDLARHVDYLVSFIPNENIVLVSEPTRNNYAIAFGATERILELIGTKTPRPVELLKLRGWLSSSPSESVSPAKLRGQLTRVLREIQQHKETWVIYEDTRLQDRLERYLQSKCQGNTDCVKKLYSPPEGQREFLRDDIDLLRECNDTYLISNSNQSLFESYVSILESQFKEPDEQLRRRINAKIEQIEHLGFQVIRVPQIGAHNNCISWSGISYVNNLLVDTLLFLPKFGLGAAEDDIFDRIQKQLPGQYRVIPVFSQNSIVYNGGIHCRTGIVR